MKNKESRSAEFKSYIDSISDPEKKNYIENRLIKEIQWYSRKCAENQKWYKRLMVVSLILSSCIPIVTLLSDEYSLFSFKVMVSVLGVSVTAISTVIAFFNFKELWIEYRSNSEMLRSRLHMYFTRSGEFKGLSEEDAFERLVVRCEGGFLRENGRWGEIKGSKS